MSRYNYDRPDQEQRYSGVPNEQTPEEAGKWKQFKNWFLKKLGRGEDYYEAKVRTQEAQANNLDADSDLKRAQAEKARAEAAFIREQAAKLEQERLPQEVPQGMPPLTGEELEAAAAKIFAKLEQLRVIHGTKVEITEGEKRYLVSDDLLHKIPIAELIDSSDIELVNAPGLADEDPGVEPLEPIDDPDAVEEAILYTLVSEERDKGLSDSDKEMLDELLTPKLKDSSPE
ncbi:MAG: hypothetical protein AAF433_09255 [Bacteroidota bacterium]